MSRPHPLFFQGRSISVKHLNDWMRHLLSFTPISTPTVKVASWGPDGVALECRTTSQLSELLEDFSPKEIKGLKVTFNSGYIKLGSQHIKIQEASVACGGQEDSPHHIYVEGTLGSLNDAKFSATSVATYPVSTNEKFKVVLWHCWVSGGSVSLRRAREIDLTAYLAP